MVVGMPKQPNSPSDCRSSIVQGECLWGYLHSSYRFHAEVTRFQPSPVAKTRQSQSPSIEGSGLPVVSCEQQTTRFG